MNLRDSAAFVRARCKLAEVHLGTLKTCPYRRRCRFPHADLDALHCTCESYTHAPFTSLGRNFPANARGQFRYPLIPALPEFFIFLSHPAHFHATVEKFLIGLLVGC